MTALIPGSTFGRHVFGLAVLAFGIVTLIWPDIDDWLQLGHIWNAQNGRILVYAAGAAQIFGGLAIQFRPTARIGSGLLGAIYLIFALTCVPRIIATPQVYDRWGNFFEQLSIATGAAIVCARLSPAWSPEAIDRIGRILFGICAASFTIEQAVYLNNTASLVPKWLPPSQTFWAVATTVLFALAVVALLTNRMALLASHLLTIMIVLFGLLVWVPLVLSDPHNHTNWSEIAETFAIAGTVWILADLLGDDRLRQSRSSRAEIVRETPNGWR
jgi:hypothetical protein